MTPLTEPKTTHPLQEALLGYLQRPGGPSWPGADGLTVDDFLLSYLQAMAAGRVPGWQHLMHDHPELAADLQALLGDQAQA